MIIAPDTTETQIKTFMDRLLSCYGRLRRVGSIDETGGLGDKRQLNLLAWEEEKCHSII